MALSWKLEINTPKGLLGSKIPTIHFYYSYLQKAILQVLKLSESLIKKILSTGVWKELGDVWEGLLKQWCTGQGPWGRKYWNTWKEFYSYSEELKLYV